MTTQTPPIERWHIDRRIDLTSILTTILIVGSAVAWGFALDSKIVQTAQQVDYLEANQKRLEERLDVFRGEFSEDLDQIHAKLDRLIERQVQ